MLSHLSFACIFLVGGCTILRSDSFCSILGDGGKGKEIYVYFGSLLITKWVNFRLAGARAKNLFIRLIFCTQNQYLILETRLFLRYLKTESCFLKTKSCFLKTESCFLKTKSIFLKTETYFLLQQYTMRRQQQALEVACNSHKIKSIDYCITTTSSY